MILKNEMLKKMIMLILLVVVGIVSIYVLYYLNSTFNIGLICFFSKITGLYCSGCGMTRAFFSLLELDFYQAIRYNVFSLLLFPTLIICMINYIHCWLFNEKNFIIKKIPNSFFIIIAILLIIYGILRNIPLFAYLAPTVV